MALSNLLSFLVAPSLGAASDALGRRRSLLLCAVFGVRGGRTTEGEQRRVVCLFCQNFPAGAGRTSRNFKQSMTNPNQTLHMPDGNP